MCWWSHWLLEASAACPTKFSLVLAHFYHQLRELNSLTTAATEGTSAISTSGKATATSSSKRHIDLVVEIDLLERTEPGEVFKWWEARNGKVSLASRAVLSHVPHRLPSLTAGWIKDIFPICCKRVIVAGLPLLPCTFPPLIVPLSLRDTVMASEDSKDLPVRSAPGAQGD